MVRKQTEDDIVVRGTGNIQMVRFKGYLGQGVAATGDDEVTVIIQTQGDSIDITMSKAEALELSKDLRRAAG